MTRSPRPQPNLTSLQLLARQLRNKRGISYKLSSTSGKAILWDQALGVAGSWSEIQLQAPGILSAPGPGSVTTRTGSGTVTSTCQPNSNLWIPSGLISAPCLFPYHYRQGNRDRTAPKQLHPTPLYLPTTVEDPPRTIRDSLP